MSHINKMKHVVIAMSGGVDSATAAVMAREAGYRTTGVTLRMRETAPETQAVLDEVVSRLDIPLHTLDREKEFLRRVLIPAAEEYASGRTPNPCCECNKCFKFAELLDFTRSIGADELWTGHYAVISQEKDLFHLKRGLDTGKDQSYFLYKLTPEMLQMIRFPLGGYTKQAIRDFAAERGFAFAKKPDSQDICFAVPDESCGETLRKAAQLPPCPGRFIYNGKTVGRHTGFHKFTIGQRNGHGIALGKPAYISKIDASTGSVELVTDKELLACRCFYLENVNQLLPVLPQEGLTVQIRYRSRPVPCRVTPLSPERWQVTPEQPLYAVTPGQAGVLYLGYEVAGGGVICL